MNSNETEVVQIFFHVCHIPFETDVSCFWREKLWQLWQLITTKGRKERQIQMGQNWISNYFCFVNYGNDISIQWGIPEFKILARRQFFISQFGLRYAPPSLGNEIASLQEFCNSGIFTGWKYTNVLQWDPIAGFFCQKIRKLRAKNFEETERKWENSEIRNF